MDKPKTTPKDFFLWAGAMVALYASVVAFIALIFDYINYAYPDAALVYYGFDPYSGGASYEMASLIVLFPLAVFLMRLIHRGIERDPSREEIWVRRWALFLTLFIAGATLAVDLITLIMYFLQGDITVRFVLKVLVVLLVVGAGFLHFLADLRGYWKAQPARSRMVGWASGALMLLTVVAGFFIFGNPMQQRLYRLDEQRITDLQQTQSQIVYYWQMKQKLPAALTDLSDSVSYFTLPKDPETGKSYVYAATGTMTFKLCATFDAPNRLSPNQLQPVYSDLPAPEKWQHGAGEVCFNRTIDAQLYPKLPAGKVAPEGPAAN